MNRIFKVDKLHYKKALEFIAVNISKTLPMLQGIDLERKCAVDGYTFYIYGKEANGGISVDGIICCTPLKMMILYVEDDTLFEKLDFFKFIKEKKPVSIMAEENTAKKMTTLLIKTKMLFEQTHARLLKYERGDVDISISEYDEDGRMKEESRAYELFEESEDMKLEAVLPLINEVRQYVGKCNYSKSDFHAVIVPRIRRGNFIICKNSETGDLVAQGTIEFDKLGIAVIGGVFTIESERRKGAGKFIVKALIERIKKNYAVPFLFVENDNDSAKKIYEGLGMKTVSRWIELRSIKGIGESIEGDKDRFQRRGSTVRQIFAEVF